MPITQELDDLLADSVASAKADIPDLDDLLTESVTSQIEAKAAKKSKDRLARGGLTPAELAEDRERLAAWEMRHVWKPEANVARFLQQECTRCGEFHYTFTGLLQRQSHRHFPEQQRRWIAVTDQVASLPNEVMTVEQTVPFCAECLDKVGFSWSKGYTEDGRALVALEDEGDDDGQA